MLPLVTRGPTSADVSQTGQLYDLHLLVRSWSPGYCSSTHCTAKPISAFTIHGLWPEFNNGSWPEYCHEGEHGTHTTGVRTAVDGPRGVGGGDTPAAAPATAAAGDAAMACEWPSFSGTDAAFHDHEWSRHGTCAAAALGGDRQAFFQTVLALNRKYDLNVAFEAAGIRPSAPTRLSATALKAAVGDAFGAAPLLHCGQGGVLQELWMCLDLQLRPVECPPAAAHVHCPPGVRLLPGAPVPTSCAAFFPDQDQGLSTAGAGPGVLGGGWKRRGGAAA